MTPLTAKEMNKIAKETTGTQLFSIPNNEEGNKFLTLARAYINPKYKLRARGRGRRVVDGKRYPKDSIPISVSDWMALYVDMASDKMFKLIEEGRVVLQKRLDTAYEKNEDLCHNLIEKDREINTLKKELDLFKMDKPQIGGTNDLFDQALNAVVSKNSELVKRLEIMTRKYERRTFSYWWNKFFAFLESVRIYIRSPIEIKRF